MKLTIQELGSFVSNYRQINSELFLKWIIQYDLHSMIAVFILILGKLPKTPKKLPILSTHENCNCIQLFGHLLHDIRKSLTVYNFSKCGVSLNNRIINILQPQNTEYVMYKFSSDKQQIFIEKPNYIKSSVFIKNVENPSKNESPPDSIYVFDIVSLMASNRIEEVLNIVKPNEFIILYGLRTLISKHTIYKILPDDQIPDSRNVIFKQKTKPRIVLYKVLSFINNDITSCTFNSTACKFRLAELIHHDRKLKSSEHITQLYYSGYRFNLVKNNNNVKLYNEYAIEKVPNWFSYPFGDIFKNIDNISIEIIMVAVNNNGLLVSKSHNTTDFYLIYIADLFICNSINYCNHPYGDRYNQIGKLIQKIDEPYVKQIPHIITQSDYEEDYNKLLLTKNIDKCYYTGFVYRNKNKTMQNRYLSYKFNTFVADVINNSGVLTRIKLNPVNTFSLCCVIPVNYFKYSMDFVAINNALVIWDNTQYIIYAHVQLKIKKINNHQIYINNIGYNWNVVNVKFNSFENGKINNIVEITHKLGMSLLHCPSLRDILTV